MGGKNDNALRLPESGPLVPPPYRSPASFIAAIRLGEVAALRQLFTHYAPLLRDQAHKMGVPADEAEDRVVTLLGDFVLHVQDTDLAPRHLARYLVGALRNCARMRHRGEARRRARDERAYEERGDTTERVVAECHSEYGLRSARAADADSDVRLRVAVEKLAARSAQALTEVERTLMIGLSRDLPLRELAAQAGITYGAARVRVHRLRERMLKLAIQHIASLEPDERREMKRFFRRAGVCLDSREGASPHMQDESIQTDHSDGGGGGVE